MTIDVAIDYSYEAEDVADVLWAALLWVASSECLGQVNNHPPLSEATQKPTGK